MCGECIGTPVPGEIIRKKTESAVGQPDSESNETGPKTDLPPGVFIEEMAGRLADNRQSEITDLVPKQVNVGVVRRTFTQIGTYAELTALIGVGAVTIFTSSMLETRPEREERLKNDKEQGKKNPIFIGRGRDKAQSGEGHAERAGRKHGVTRVKPPKKKRRR